MKQRPRNPRLGGTRARQTLRNYSVSVRAFQQPGLDLEVRHRDFSGYSAVTAPVIRSTPAKSTLVYLTASIWRPGLGGHGDEVPCIPTCTESGRLFRQLG